MPRRHTRAWKYSSTILDLGTKGRSVVSFTPQPLYPLEKSLRYSLDGRQVEPQSGYEHCGEEKYLVPAGNQTPSLYRLLVRSIVHLIYLRF
jgi:hypothetical protein